MQQNVQHFAQNIDYRLTTHHYMFLPRTIWFYYCRRKVFVPRRLFVDFLWNFWCVSSILICSNCKLKATPENSHILLTIPKSIHLLRTFPIFFILYNKSSDSKCAPRPVCGTCAEFRPTNVCALPSMMRHCWRCCCCRGGRRGCPATDAVDGRPFGGPAPNRWAMRRGDATPMTCRSWMVDRSSWRPLSSRWGMGPAMAPLTIRLWSTVATLYVTLRRPPATRTYCRTAACRVWASRWAFCLPAARRTAAQWPACVEGGSREKGREKSMG